MSSLSIADMNTVVKMLIGHDRAGSLDLSEATMPPRPIDTLARAACIGP